MFGLLTLVLGGQLHAESFGELLPYWDVSVETNTNKIDHSSWQKVLDKQLESNHPSGINRFDYGLNSAREKSLLSSYLNEMQSLDPRTFSKNEQMAYWINIYNAQTVKLIADHYPVESIKDIGGSIFSFGPWDDEVITVAGKELSLNDIEHGILRPIFRDNRIHYAVNCASIGCPNLSARVFTANNMNRQLNEAARSFINHPRGLSINRGTLTASSIFDWYKEDFGSRDKTLIQHFIQYANPDLSRKLYNFSGDIKYDYNWLLNES